MPVRAPRPARRRARLRCGVGGFALAAAAAGVAGCGSAAVADLPPVAQPRVSPPASRTPAGRVVRLGPPAAALVPGRTTGPGGAPEGLAFDPASGLLAVGVRDPAQLVLVDGASGRVARRVGLPGAARDLAVQGGDVLVPAERAGRLLRVRARDGRVTGDLRLGGRPHDVVGGALAGSAFVTDGAGSAVAVVRGDRRERSIAVGAQPTGLAPVSPGRLAVVSGRERLVDLVEVATGRRLGRADAGVGPTHAVAHDRWLWVTDTAGDALLVFRTRPALELVRRVHLPGGPYGIALDTEKLRLWITLTATNEVVELPAHGRPHELRRLPTVPQPDGLAVDPVTHRVFVASRRDGTLQLLDPPPLG